MTNTVAEPETESTTEPPSRPEPDRDESPSRATLKELRRPVAGLSRAGVLLAGIGALGRLVPFIGIAELARVLLAPGPPDTDSTVATAVIISIGLVIGWSCTGAALWLTHLADDRLQGILRRRLVAHLGRVELGWYTDTNSGAVRKAALDDIDDLHHLIAHHDVELAAAAVLPLGGLAYLVWVDWRLALLAVATLPIYVVAYSFMMRGFAEKMIQLDAAFSRVSSAIAEFVHGISVVKAFGQTNRAHAGYRRAVGEFSERYSGWVRPILRLEALTSMALSVPVVVLVGLGGGIWFVRAGWVEPLDVLAEVLVAVVLPSVLLTLNEGFSAQRKAMAAAGRISRLLDTPQLPVSEEPKEPEHREVVFDSVSFGYKPGAPVLHDVDLVCLSGTVTALVGSSGAGKSTLAKLLLRFHDVIEGAITVGGADVREILPERLYRHVGFVLQDVQLLHATVADNLRLGRPDATDDALVAAAKAARIHDRIVRLPRGYDSVIGEDAQFSGGEAQRVSIARALLADTPVLVLDEATAYADAESEAQIQDALSVLAQGRTVLVIAHRLSTITGVDQIVVLHKGRIAERGTHTELLAAGGRYAAMWATYNEGNDR